MSKAIVVLHHGNLKSEKERERETTPIVHYLYVILILIKCDVRFPRDFQYLKEYWNGFFGKVKFLNVATLLFITSDKNIAQ